MILYCKFVILYMENYTWKKINSTGKILILYMTVKQQPLFMNAPYFFRIDVAFTTEPGNKGRIRVSYSSKSPIDHFRGSTALIKQPLARRVSDNLWCHIYLFQIFRVIVAIETCSDVEVDQQQLSSLFFD